MSFLSLYVILNNIIYLIVITLFPEPLITLFPEPLTVILEGVVGVALHSVFDESERSPVQHPLNKPSHSTLIHDAPPPANTFVLHVVAIIVISSIAEMILFLFIKSSLYKINHLYKYKMKLIHLILTNWTNFAKE